MSSHPCRVLLQACLLAATALSAQAADFTLAQVLSAPFPAGLVASPVGAEAAWVFNDRGARNLWLAEKGADGAFHSRALTQYAGDDGVDMGEIAWAPDGKSVAYTRGGDLEGGPLVNPLSLPGGPPAQNIWLAPLDGGKPRLVGPGHSAAISPRGDRIVYQLDGQIWSAPLTGGAPAQLVHDRGTDTSMVFSPDGTRLAFVSIRDGRGIIGVLDIAAQKITWLAPSADTDGFPEWSPDGKSVAFVRQAAGQGVVDFTPHRTGEPWRLMVADAATGEGHALWTAPAGAGSVFHNTLGARALFWAAGGQIVLPWERTGWLHLYAIPASGGTPRELTTGGNFEVFNIALSTDRTRLAYSANAGDIDRWHVFSVDLQGGAPRALSTGAGMEDYPVLTAQNDVLALHSDARAPVRPVQIDGATLRDLAPGTIPADFPADKLVTPQAVTFLAPDGLRVHGELFLPPHKTAHAPSMLFFHGGPYRQMLPDWHPMDAYSFMYGFNQYLANQGYIVLSVNYRGGIGYGLDFREAPGFGAAGASEEKDIVAGAAYLRARPDVDPARMGIWGGSYGGLMTALGLARAPQYFAAGVDYAGVHDWRGELPQFTGAAAKLAYESSAISTMSQWRAPVLVAHCDDDRAVAFSQSVELIEALRARHVPVTQFVVPDEVHVMLRAQSWLNFFSAADGFFAGHLLGSQGAQVP